jgi:hypothetical protein
MRRSASGSAQAMLLARLPQGVEFGLYVLHQQLPEFRSGACSDQWTGRRAKVGNSDREGTFAGTHGNGRDAPLADIASTSLRSVQIRRSRATQPTPSSAIISCGPIHPIPLAPPDSPRCAKQL